MTFVMLLVLVCPPSHEHVDTWPGDRCTCHTGRIHEHVDVWPGDRYIYIYIFCIIVLLLLLLW